MTPAKNFLLVVSGAALAVGPGQWVSTILEPEEHSYSANAAIAGTPPVAAPPETDRVGGETYNRARDGLFYVQGKVNGKPVRFLLDTGANLVVLTPEDAQRAGVPTRGAGAGDSIETVGGRSRMERVTLDRVRVAGKSVSSVEAAVVHNGLRVSILGQNMLSRMGPITISGDTIEVR